MTKSIRDYREMITSDEVKEILRKEGVEPVRENSSMIVYPTVCHNHKNEAHSAKLYFYKKNNMFKCYTECNSVFDIFELIIKMKRLEGEEISLRKSLSICGIQTTESIEENQYYGIKDQLDYLYEINNDAAEEPVALKIYSKDILDRFIFDINFLKPWLNENISVDSLIKYNIKFDTVANAIIMPYFTDTKQLIGIRGRFLGEDAKAKYMPIKYQGEYLAHPTGKVLYGLDINKEAISKYQTVILFEGEKSVMKMDTIYGSNNVSVAVSGRNISKEHIQLMLKYNIRNVILAFDRDYKSFREIEKEINEYVEIFKHAKNFFNVSVIVDYDFILGHKNSPIDQGKEVFEQLMQKRVFL